MLRSLTSRRTRTSSGARQGQLGQLPQQGVAGKAAAPTAARRTNPALFMGRRSALILSYAGEWWYRERRQKLREDVHVINAFLTQCSLFVLLSVSILGESFLVVFARFSQGSNCVRVSSRVVEGQQVVTCKERTGCSEAAQVASCTATQGHGSRQSAGSFQSKARKKKGLWGPIAPRAGARRRRRLYRLL